MKKRNIGVQDIIPFAVFAVIFAFFSIASKAGCCPRSSLQMLLASR
jgi:hypothetical protein